ncbi:MAG: hypothetical protein ACRC14_07700 [Paracoccaceae bacterium]
MPYDLARLDGDDPTYAPNVSRSRDSFYWRAPRPAVTAGYSITRCKLEGTELQRAARARELTRDALRFMAGEDASPRVKHGTWGWLISAYLHDDTSPFQEVEGNTQAQYRGQAEYWRKAIGADRIANMNYTLVKTIQNGMKTNGRSADFISKAFSALRRIVRFGVLIQTPGASVVAEVLSATRFQGPLPRDANPTGAQVMAVVRAADDAGDSRFALALLLQWWLCLRPMDVRGEFIPMKPGESGGIVMGKLQWRNGLTWDMISPDLMTIRKVISKTKRSDGRAAIMDLSALDDVRARLEAIPLSEHVGPVILWKGRPYDRKTYGLAWRKYAKAAGVPETVQCRDLRAGAVNDAVDHGATKIEVQHAARHSNGDTTERYIRGRDDTANRVIQMRAGTPAQRG